MKSNCFRWTLAVTAVFALPGPSVGNAQDGAPASQKDAEETKAAEIGIRFTPKMAAAMGRKFSAEMKPRYDLSDEQVKEIAPIIQRQFMEFANKNAELGRDMIETMVEGTIENDGRFDKDGAKEFAKLANKFMPKFKDLMTRSSAEIAMKMNVKQRLKYTADVGVLAAGLMIFENRMKRWEEGDIPANPYPFFDGPRREPAKVDSGPEDPNETAEHRKARREVERWIGWQINRDDQWQDYLDRSAKYYGFTEVQMTSASGILKECKTRVQTIKTASWKQAVMENRIARQLASDLPPEISQGPWMVSLEESFKKIMQPLNDLDAEFKRRIEDLPNSAQRAGARESVRKTLAEKGVQQLPN